MRYETTTKSMDEIIKDGKPYPCSFPIGIIPNSMGINLVAVDSLTWTKREDGQIVNLTINFMPQENANFQGASAPRGAVEFITFETLMYRLKEQHKSCKTCLNLIEEACKDINIVKMSCYQFEALRSYIKTAKSTAIDIYPFIMSSVDTYKVDIEESLLPLFLKCIKSAKTQFNLNYVYDISYSLVACPKTFHKQATHITITGSKRHADISHLNKPLKDIMDLA